MEIEPQETKFETKIDNYKKLKYKEDFINVYKFNFRN